MEKERFDPIDGLRGYLALWVGVGHALFAGGVIHSTGALRLLMDGAPAVMVFVIISGFVITHLILQKAEPYSLYISRRFLRLFPVFALLCVAGYFLMPVTAWYSYNVPWAGAADWAQRLARVDEYSDQAARNLAPHALAHATMLHSAIPMNLLPSADSMFLGPAWSISLEWQFYLIAPLLIWALRGPAAPLIVIAALAAWYVVGRGAFGVFGAGALPISAPYFAIGIASRFAFPWLSAIKASPLLVVMTLGLLAVTLTTSELALLPWALFFPFLLWSQHGPISGPLYRFVFANPAILFVGKVSYSLYLVHFLVIQCALAALLWLAPAAPPAAFLIVALLALTLSLPVSAALYFAVEKPAIMFGKTLTAPRAREVAA